MKTYVKAVQILAILTMFSLGCDKDDDSVNNYTLEDCTETISFNQQILPMIENNCIACHNGANSPTLTTHEQISANAEDIIESLTGEEELMPKGGPALHDSLIKQFSCWMLQGKKNN